MCLIVFDWTAGERLVLSANRDEFFKRPSEPLAPWPDASGIYAGRDIEQGGTWLGVNQQGSFAALTNVRVPCARQKPFVSRGEIVSNYLQQTSKPESFLENLLKKAHTYAPFNVLFGNINALYYLTNYPTPRWVKVENGIHALSNAQLDTPWPKALLAQSQLQNWLMTKQPIKNLTTLLNRTETFADETLPSTGVSLAWERVLSAQFIQTPNYGTRCSSALEVTQNNLILHEVTWNRLGEPTDNQKITLRI